MSQTHVHATTIDAKSIDKTVGFQSVGTLEGWKRGYLCRRRRRRVSLETSYQMLYSEWIFIDTRNVEFNYVHASTDSFPTFLFYRCPESNSLQPPHMEILRKAITTEISSRNLRGRRSRAGALANLIAK